MSNNAESRESCAMVVVAVANRGVAGRQFSRLVIARGVHDLLSARTRMNWRSRLCERAGEPFDARVAHLRRIRDDWMTRARQVVATLASRSKYFCKYASKRDDLASSIEFLSLKNPSPVLLFAKFAAM